MALALKHCVQLPYLWFTLQLSTAHQFGVAAHTHLIGSVLNDALRIVTICLRPTPTDHLRILLSIQPAELRRLGATLSLAKRCTLDPDHNLHGQLAGALDVPQERLRSRHPFVPAAGKLLNDLSKLGTRAAQ